MRNTMLRAAASAALLSVPFLSPASELGAQAQGRGGAGEARIERLPGGFSVVYGASNRPVLGVALGESGRADTAGVRIESVTPDGPAAKAGLKAGDVITAINGVNLRVSATDADDPALDGLGQRRLQRTLSRLKAGDNVDLRVASGGQTRTVTVKTVAMDELNRGTGSTRAMTRVGGSGQNSSDENRGAIGISIGGTGSARDTLGLFVNSVIGGGPAEKAGIIEGARIAAVNGVDVRVPREDFEDPGALSVRANRFTREVRKVAPGSSLTLRVFEGGRYRDVSVTAVKPSDLPNRGFSMSVGDGAFSFDLPGATIFRSPGAMPFTEIPGIRFRQNLRDGEGTYLFDRDAMRKSMDELRTRLQDMGRDMRIQLRDGNDRPVIVRTAPRRSATSL